MLIYTSAILHYLLDLYCHNSNILLIRIMGGGKSQIIGNLIFIQTQMLISIIYLNLRIKYYPINNKKINKCLSLSKKHSGIALKTVLLPKINLTKLYLFSKH